MNRHVAGMGRRAMASYLLIAVPFSAAIIALGVFLPLNAVGGPEETRGVWVGLSLFGLMLVLAGLTVLLPATVSWWHRTTASAAYRRDPAAGLAAAEQADKLELRFVSSTPVGMRTGPGIPAVARRVNRLLAWMWGLGVMVAVVAIIWASIG